MPSPSVSIADMSCCSGLDAVDAVEIVVVDVPPAAPEACVPVLCCNWVSRPRISSLRVWTGAGDVALPAALVLSVGSGKLDDAAAEDASLPLAALGCSAA